jgi:beta-galactosidase
VLAPALYLLDDAAAANLAAYVEAGGTLLVGPYSGVVDAHDRVRLGGYPGALRDLLGVRVEQYCPLPAGATVALDNGAVGRTWVEQAHAAGATVVASYLDGPAAGRPALTRRQVGTGTAWYLGTRLADLDPLLDRLGLPSRELVEVVRSHAGGPRYRFLFNHGEAAATVDGSGTDLLTGTGFDRSVTVPAGAMLVLREERR